MEAMTPTRISGWRPIESFGDRIRQIRHMYGELIGRPSLTQEEFGDMVRISKATIAAWEKNRNIPRDREAIAMKLYLLIGVDPEYLIGHPIEMPPPPGSEVPRTGSSTRGTVTSLHSHGSKAAGRFAYLKEAA